jgi:hypothetical protein
MVQWLAPRECFSALLFTSRFVAVMLPSKEQQTGDHDRSEGAEAVRHDQVHAGMDAPYRSGACRGWRKVKTMTWPEANRERWRLFERAK